MLDIECFSFLNRLEIIQLSYVYAKTFCIYASWRFESVRDYSRKHLTKVNSFFRALEDDMAPIVIMATNRGITKIRGTDYKSPHGIPIDLLDRMIIIPTTPYPESDLHTILKIRCEEEDCEIANEGLTVLTKIANDASLRYAIQVSLIWQKIHSVEIRDDFSKNLHIFLLRVSYCLSVTWPLKAFWKMIFLWLIGNFSKNVPYFSEMKLEKSSFTSKEKEGKCLWSQIHKR